MQSVLCYRVAIGRLRQPNNASATWSNTNTAFWDTEAPLRRPRASAALVAYESRLYVMGGTDDEWLPMSDCEILDDLHSSSRWRPGPQLVYARSNPTAVVSKHGEILVFGGASALPRPLASYELLETQPSSSDLSQGRLLGVMSRGGWCCCCYSYGSVSAWGRIPRKIAAAYSV